jgi:DNA-binding NarL/FixJ family response regulator
MKRIGLSDTPPRNTVAIVEDDDRVRRSLVSMIRHIPGCACVGDYGSGEAALDGLAQVRARVVVMDINLPGMDGVECVRQLAVRDPGVLIIMLTVHEDTDTIFEALSAGASGYLLKPVRTQELAEALQDMLGGGAPMSSSIARKVVQTFRKAPTGTEAPATDTALSVRETEVLHLLSKGCMYKQIGDTLEISYGTVRTHIQRIYKKLHVRSRAQAVALHRKK